MKSGIRTIKDLFEYLNANCTYVVLRNWDDIFDENIYGTGHEDIDIMCDNIDIFIQLTKAQRINGDKYRDNLVVTVDSMKVRFDVRYIGDNYYPAEWQKKILDRRIQLPNSLYVMCEEDYVYSLAYHALCQKPSLSEEYYSKITVAYKKLLNMDSSINIDKADLIRILMRYCTNQGYRVFTPEDPGVFINWENMKQLHVTDSYNKKIRRLNLRISQKIASIKKRIKK